MNAGGAGVRIRGTERWKRGNPALKIVMVGKEGAGKTSLVRRFANNVFDRDQGSTPAGALDYTLCSIVENERRIKLHVWDTPGDPEARMAVFGCFRKADAIVVVYDVTDADAFVGLSRWLSYIRAFSDQNTRFYVLGAKRDLIDCDSQAITVRMVKRFLKTRQLCSSLTVEVLPFETSALYGQGVFDAFSYIVADLMLRREGFEKRVKGRGIASFEVGDSPPTSRHCFCC